MGERMQRVERALFNTATPWQEDQPELQPKLRATPKKEEEQAPTVRVKIGRLEIKSPPVFVVPPRSRVEPRLALGDYLQHRRRGRR